MNDLIAKSSGNFTGKDLKAWRAFTGPGCINNITLVKTAILGTPSWSDWVTNYPAS